ncbi:MarR family winged helix-turn-helix transcriptional regulator [Burkholderia sp. AU4i]|uniref:MarR family winged helix-turn-helix transcriptional regulator n=1 Tax=Burkholderia sp. AU4i TaxID=1335308 RepID=UPI00211CE39E|nr:MarR family winged helix-turn-helix transcriptional regulator [Burkholderia sp. AU4i]
MERADPEKRAAEAGSRKRAPGSGLQEAGCRSRRHETRPIRSPIACCRVAILRQRIRASMTSRSPSAKSRKSSGAPAQSFNIDQFIPYRLLRITTRITAVASKRYADGLGITIAESRVVNVLASKGPMSTFQIADHTGMDRAKVSRATQRLTASGQLTRAVNENDKRLILLTLTDSGWTLYNGILEILEEFEHEISGALDAGGRRQLLELIGKLDSRFETFAAGVLSND